jgi:hypothetical protein
MTEPDYSKFRFCGNRTHDRARLGYCRNLLQKIHAFIVAVKRSPEQKNYPATRLMIVASSR